VAVAALSNVPHAIHRPVCAGHGFVMKSQKRRGPAEWRIVQESADGRMFVEILHNAFKTIR
jgi:hypothetical protein